MTRAVLFVLVIAMAVMHSYQQDITPAPAAGEGGDTGLGPDGSAGPRCLRPNEVYYTCGGCEQKCEIKGPRPCPKICHRGCQCRTGFVRRRDGACVRRQNCPTDY